MAAKGWINVHWLYVNPAFGCHMK